MTGKNAAECLAKILNSHAQGWNAILRVKEHFLPLFAR
jgi:hypothetical protein